MLFIPKINASGSMSNLVKLLPMRIICKYLLISLLFTISGSLFAQQQETPPVELKPISENLYEITGGRGAGGGAYIGDNGVLIIDAKMDRTSVEQTIQQIGKITDKPIKYLVNTHSDGDHIWGNQFFPQSVLFVAHENCRKEFFVPKGNGDPSDWNNPELAPFIPSITFKDHMEIYLGSKRIELWYFGIGHTTGDAVVYFPDENIAFLGDGIFMDRPQLIHSYKGGNSFEYVKTITKMLETLNAEKFCSGHSDMISRPEVVKHVEQMKKRQAVVMALVKEGKNLEEIQKEFEENETRLVESIYHEITNK